MQYLHAKYEIFINGNLIETVYNPSNPIQRTYSNFVSGYNTVYVKNWRYEYGFYWYDWINDTRNFQVYFNPPWVSIHGGSPLPVGSTNYYWFVATQGLAPYSYDWQVYCDQGGDGYWVDAIYDDLDYVYVYRSSYSLKKLRCRVTDSHGTIVYSNEIPF